MGNHNWKVITLKSQYKYIKEKKTYCKSDKKHREQQKDKHEDVKKGPQTYKMWRSEVRLSKPFLKNVCELI